MRTSRKVVGTMQEGADVLREKLERERHLTLTLDREIALCESELRQRRLKAARDKASHSLSVLTNRLHHAQTRLSAIQTENKRLKAELTKLRMDICSLKVHRKKSHSRVLQTVESARDANRSFVSAKHAKSMCNTEIVEMFDSFRREDDQADNLMSKLKEELRRDALLSTRKRRSLPDSLNPVVIPEDFTLSLLEHLQSKWQQSLLSVRSSLLSHRTMVEELIAAREKIKRKTGKELEDVAFELGWVVDKERELKEKLVALMKDVNQELRTFGKQLYEGEELRADSSEKESLAVRIKETVLASEHLKSHLCLIGTAVSILQSPLHSLWELHTSLHPSKSHIDLTADITIRSIHPALAAIEGTVLAASAANGGVSHHFRKLEEKSFSAKTKVHKLSVSTAGAAEDSATGPLTLSEFRQKALKMFPISY